jgi:adenylate cyclase
MNIYLNVNDLVEQLIKMTQENNKANAKALEVSEKFHKLEISKMDRELEDLKSKLDFERDLDAMSKEHENENKDDNIEIINYNLKKIVNG